ncbi:MAG: glyoxalase superfamily protein [Pseudomonadota bacterium]
MKRDLPTPTQAKSQARRLREDLAAAGIAISHGQALEKIAHRHGFRDWNALHAAIAERWGEAWRAGGRVTGRYLSQPFAATVLVAEELRPGWFRLVLDFDEAVDVVRFDSFSNLRKRIRVVIGPKGHSKERTSDGEPHLRLAHEGGVTDPARLRVPR